MNKLLQALSKNLEDNKAFTENGALSNKSTNSAVLDFFYHQPARTELDVALFTKAFDENVLLTLKTLFYVRDIRGGQGKRLAFRQALNLLYTNYPAIFNAIVKLVAEYGRWDDILIYFNSPTVVDLVKNQLKTDFYAEHVSLLAKWMPSENTSSRNTRNLAQEWIRVLGMTARDYRHMLTRLRSRINLVETHMSFQNWDEIDYERVPSNAAKLYRKAFSRHDGERYVEYLQSVAKGEKKIHAGTLYPVDIAKKYITALREDSDIAVDQTLEALWKALPNYAEGDFSNSLVVADVSGSMYRHSDLKVAPIDVCLSLTIYLSERNNGDFKDYFLTFSENSHLVKLVGKNLATKIKNLSTANWGMSTNLQSSFEKILEYGLKNRVPESDMPKQVIIISDMQFNSCVKGTNLENIQKKYAKAGYKLPKIVFWNVDSRVNEAPALSNTEGVYLVSGYSPVIYQTVCGSKSANPYQLMLETLNKERYDLVESALHSLVTNDKYAEKVKKAKITKAKRGRLEKLPF